MSTHAWGVLRVVLSLGLSFLPVLAAGAKPPPRAWIGVFEPSEPVAACADCTKPTIVPRAGAVRVLTPSDGVAASGDVVIVSPLLGVIARGHVDGGRVAVPWFNYDTRGDNASVLVLPATVDPVVVDVAAADVAAIKKTLLRDDVLSHVRRSLDATELGGIDVDGDRKADFVVTYGCNAWGDGQCQSHGQFFVARRGPAWVEMD